MNALAENTPVKLRTREVRDLAWACFSPPLLHSAHLEGASIRNCALTLTPERRKWLQALDRAPGTLQEFIASRRNSRLGIYFETLWQFFLREDSAVELLAHNLPVRDAGLTLGEFDCIYYCHQRQRAVHLELAVKFYLNHPGSGEKPADHQQRWLGPNARDRLDLKLQRLLTHQLPLSTHPLGARALAAIGAENPLSELELKGRLYRHIHHQPPLPPAYNRQLLLQEWCRVDEFPALAAANGDSYAMLQREQWLAPVRGDEVTTLRQTASVAEACRDKPVQLAVIDNTGNERKRLFIVPEGWPARNE